MTIRQRHHVGMRTPLALCIALATLASTLSTSAAHAQRASASPRYGGTVRVAFTSDLATFDPAQAIIDDWWIMMGTLYNGLYQFDRNGIPQLDLAAAPPAISADRKVWTFKLRKGVRFSNGMELTANDVKFTLTRTLDPHLRPAVSWGQTTDDIFVGSHAFVTGKAKSVAGIQVLDRYTIRLVLARPVAILPDILASSYNMIVPQAVVTKESAQYFASHPIGTGPYVLQSWQRGVKVVFVRNPHYFHTGKPYIATIICYVNIPSSVLALKIQKGELDGYANDQEVTAPELMQMRSNPSFARYLIAAPATFSLYLYLNVHAYPTSNLKFRQAVAMAIRRRHLVQLLGGNAIASYQIYIPIDPQYDPTLPQHPIYPYDPVKAAALLKASGYGGQAVSLLYGNDAGYQVSTVPGIQQDLRQIGINLSLHGVSTNSNVSISSSLSGHTINFGGWSIDFPDAYDIYSGQFDCGVAAAGGPAGSHYCDPVADALVSKAEALPLGAERNALLRQAQVRILRSASAVPLFYLKSTEIASPRVQGFYYQPMFGWQFENFWLKS